MRTSWRGGHFQIQDTVVELQLALTHCTPVPALPEFLHTLHSHTHLLPASLLDPGSWRGRTAHISHT